MKPLAEKYCMFMGLQENISYRSHTLGSIDIYFVLAVQALNNIVIMSGLVLSDLTGPNYFSRLVSDGS